MSVIIYGPQGCGKTTMKEALAKHYGLRNIADDWKPGDDLPDNTLALTNVPGVENAMDFFKVKESIGTV